MTEHYLRKGGISMFGLVAALTAAEVGSGILEGVLGICSVLNAVSALKKLFDE